MVFCCRCCRCLRLFCCLGTVSLSLAVNSPVLCVLWVSRVWRMFHVSWRLRCFCCLLLLIVFVDPNARIVGDQGLDFPNLLEVSCRGMASCLFWRTGVALIDTPAMMIIVARWVLLWYSRRPPDALVMFVGEAVLWHQGGLLPWPLSWCSRCSSCETLASLVENNVNSARRDRQQWCPRLSLLVATVPSSDNYVAFKARFL